MECTGSKPRFEMGGSAQGFSMRRILARRRGSVKAHSVPSI
jgi:hypothetical protein